MTPTFRISLSSKFAENISEPITEIFYETYKHLENRRPENIKKILWKMSYNPEKHLPDYGLIPENAMTEESLISNENSNSSSSNKLVPINSAQIKLFVNELLSNFKKTYPDLLKITLPESCKHSFKNLLNAVDGNELIAYVVYERCLYHLYNSSNEIERTLALLVSNDEKVQFGGIRSISFNRDESNFLKPYHFEIHNLLKDMFKESMETKTKIYNSLKTSYECIISRVEPSVIQKPKTIVKSKRNIDNIENLESVSTNRTKTDTEKAVPVFKAVTPESVLTNLSLFKSIDFEVLSEFHKLGFNINEIVEKKDSIITLLKAYEALI